MQIFHPRLNYRTNYASSAIFSSLGSFELSERGGELGRNCVNFSTAHDQLTSPLFFAPVHSLYLASPSSSSTLLPAALDFYDSAHGKIVFFQERSLRVRVFLPRDYFKILSPSRSNRTPWKENFPRGNPTDPQSVNIHGYTSQDHAGNFVSFPSSKTRGGISKKINTNTSLIWKFC